MSERFLAIINPAAGGGRCGKLAPAALERVRGCGIQLEIAQSTHPGEATTLARSAYARGARNFLAVGGDGTAFEILNGVFPEALSAERPVFGFLPVGRGNSFLRDFTTNGLEYSIEAIRKGRRRACDVIRLRHAGGDLYYINMLNLGFAADVGETANRKFNRWGHAGYTFGVLARLAGLEFHAFAHRFDGGEWDRRPCLFLAFGNTKFTGGNMMITPSADPFDGLIEYVRCSPIGRLRLLWNFRRLFTGTYVRHPLASRASAKRVEFNLREPVNVIVDGEVMRLECRSLDILPGSLDVVV